MEKQQILAAAIGSLLAMGVATNASAADGKAEMEKCYGVAKAGSNDCATNKTSHSNKPAGRINKVNRRASSI